jgi:hypothetical protein
VLEELAEQLPDLAVVVDDQDVRPVVHASNVTGTLRDLG